MNDVLSSPLFLTWEITNACNLRCKVCYNGSTSRMTDEIKSDEIPFVIERIAECNPLFVNLTGGDPLLRSDLFDIIAQFKEKGIDVQMSTNGYLLDELMAIKLKNAGVSGMQVSIDGFKGPHDYIRGKGSFDKAVSALKILIKQGFKTSVGTIMTAMNYGEISEFTSFIRELGANKIGVFRFVPIGRGASHPELQLDTAQLQWLSEKLNLLEMEYGIEFFKCDHSLSFFSGILKNGGACELGYKCLCIRPNGDVVGCPFFPLPLGNIRERSLLDIWRNSELLKQIREDVKLENLEGKCRECPTAIKDVCRGGCKAMSYAAYGNIKRPDPRCWR